ncbi:hypothetical protein [Pimelobacter simplex]|uniref:hypothetical protein n=1 Tax=Nocardioides simplex TaxID=2045 RepID=UPI0019319C10|nr:hypothetical protein [Pimelobacter simplex]
MSVVRTQPPEVSGERRVREQARDAVALMAFSASLSVGCALLLVLTHLAGR